MTLCEAMSRCILCNYVHPYLCPAGMLVWAMSWSPAPTLWDSDSEAAEFQFASAQQPKAEVRHDSAFVSVPVVPVTPAAKKRKTQGSTSTGAVPQPAIQDKEEVVTPSASMPKRRPKQQPSTKAVPQPAKQPTVLAIQDKDEVVTPSASMPKLRPKQQQSTKAVPQPAMQPTLLAILDKDAVVPPSAAMPRRRRRRFQAEETTVAVEAAYNAVSREFVNFKKNVVGTMALVLKEAEAKLNSPRVRPKGKVQAVPAAKLRLRKAAHCLVGAIRKSVKVACAARVNISNWSAWKEAQQLRRKKKTTEATD